MVAMNLTKPGSCRRVKNSHLWSKFEVEVEFQLSCYPSESTDLSFLGKKALTLHVAHLPDSVGIEFFLIIGCID